MMKRALMLATAVAFATAAEAQLYKYTDPKTGKTVYTDQPPVGTDSKAVNVRNTGGPSTKSAVEQDKAAEKGRKKVAEDAKKAGEAEQRAAQAAERCQAAKTNYQIYADGGRIQKLNAQGERELLTDEEIESKRASSRRQMEEACKAP
jgi:hypothetical protein